MVQSIDSFVGMLKDLDLSNIIKKIDAYNARNGTNIISKEYSVIESFMIKFNKINNDLKSIEKDTTKEERLEIYKALFDLILEAGSKLYDIHDNLYCEYNNEDKLYEKHLAECNGDDEEYNRREANGEYDVDDDNINKFISEEIVRSLIVKQEDLSYGILIEELNEHIRRGWYDNKDFYGNPDNYKFF
jgi:hypothetical protein